MLTALKQTEEANGRGAKGGDVINGIRCDPATAEHISGHPGGDANF